MCDIRTAEMFKDNLGDRHKLYLTLHEADNLHSQEFSGTEGRKLLEDKEERTKKGRKKE